MLRRLLREEILAGHLAFNSCSPIINQSGSERRPPARRGRPDCVSECARSATGLRFLERLDAILARIGTMNRSGPNVGQASRLPSERSRASGKANLPSASPTGAGETPALP